MSRNVQYEFYLLLAYILEVKHECEEKRQPVREQGTEQDSRMEARIHNS